MTGEAVFSVLMQA